MEGWAPPSELRWNTFRSLQAPCRPRARLSLKSALSAPSPLPTLPGALQNWKFEVKVSKPFLFTGNLPPSSMPAVKQADTSPHCVGSERPTQGFMALGESEPPLNRWPQEGHNSCLTFDSLI